MRIGYYVQGDTDEAVVWGLVKRWCPAANLAPGTFRGSSRESFRREIRKSLLDLRDDKECDIVVVLTDADGNPWRHVKTRESDKIPAKFRDLTVFGVADRNIESWLAVNREALAVELECQINEIPDGDPSNFIKRRLGLNDRDRKQAAKIRVRDYVSQAPLKSWIEGSESFEDFYRDARSLALRLQCAFPNELEN